LEGVSARIWRWIKDIQATKYEQSYTTENKNLQSELKKSTYQGDGIEDGWITYILQKRKHRDVLKIGL